MNAGPSGPCPCRPGVSLASALDVHRCLERKLGGWPCHRLCVRAVGEQSERCGQRDHHQGLGPTPKASAGASKSTETEIGSCGRRGWHACIGDEPCPLAALATSPRTKSATHVGTRPRAERMVHTLILAPRGQRSTSPARPKRNVTRSKPGIHGLFERMSRGGPRAAAWGP
jgi:hypothetical protein